MNAILLPPMTVNNPVSTYLDPMHASAIMASGYIAMDAIAQVCVTATTSRSSLRIKSNFACCLKASTHWMDIHETLEGLHYICCTYIIILCGEKSQS